MGTATVVILALIGVWLLGSIVSCWLGVLLWRRSMDVDFIAFMVISTLSLLTSWLGAAVAAAYLAAGKVIVRKKDNGAS